MRRCAVEPGMQVAHRLLRWLPRRRRARPPARLSGTRPHHLQVLQGWLEGEEGRAAAKHWPPVAAGSGPKRHRATAQAYRGAGPEVRLDSPRAPPLLNDAAPAARPTSPPILPLALKRFLWHCRQALYQRLFHAPKPLCARTPRLTSSKTRGCQSGMILSYGVLRELIEKGV